MYAGVESLLKIGAWECDLATDRLTWTPGVYDLFGVTPGAPLERRRIVDLYEDESRACMEAMRAQALRTGAGFSLDAQIVTLDGDRRWIRLSAQVEQRDGRSVRLFGGKQDVTLEKLRWDRLRLQAERDSLTGLANRDVFEHRLRDVLDDRCSEALAGLLIVDVDRFKPINDRFGHAAGDAVLCETARRLTEAFEDALLVARIGGDEFAVLMRRPLDRVRLEPMIARAVHRLKAPVAWKGRSIAASVSIGAAIVTDGRRLARDDLFAQADAALYAAKASGRAAHRIFDAFETAQDCRPERRRA